MNSQSIMIIQFCALVVLFVDLLFVLLQEPSAMQKHLVVMLIATILMFVGYIMEIRATTLEAAELGAAAAYLGKPFIMLYSLTFICSFYDIKINKVLFYVLNALCAGIFALVYTNPIHHLYYGTTAFDASLPFSPLIVTHGKLYFVYIVSAVLFFLSCLFCIIKGYRKNKTKQNLKISLFMSMMIVFGITGYGTYLANTIEGYDTTLLGIFGSAVCLSAMFFRYNIFDYLSFAKNEALNDSSIGLVVLNQSGAVSYSNLVGERLTNSIGLECLRGISEVGENVIIDDRVYFIKTKEINMGGNYYGKSIEITDITISYNYQQQLEHDVNERTEQIENIQREIIGSLASIVEARSSETGEHIARTRELVELIAKALRDKGLYKDVLTDSYISLMANAAPLHDIGKISVPDAVLNKPGKLTPEEFELMKLHPEEGAKIIEKTMKGIEEDEYVEIAVEIARYHQEWFNGTGYPYHLKGKDIPLSARIMALADTYDALISRRCYKPPFDVIKAVEIIKEESGTHFDPEIAEVFIETIQK